MNILSNEIGKGSKILIQEEDGSKTLAKCTGVTNNDLIHFMYWTKDNCPKAGMIGRDFVKKAN